MAFSIKNAGVWSDVKGISIKDGGTWKTVQNSYIKKAGTWVEFFANATVLTITTTVNNYNLFTAAGSPTQPVTVILNINSGASINATSGNTALTIGQFPTGSIIQINNSGSILGYGGVGGTAGAGSSGGDAIYANYANQTVTINNLTGGLIYGGGGGGGKGGAGGTGGTGGQGRYSAYNYQGEHGAGNDYFWDGSGRSYAKWNYAEVVNLPYETAGPVGSYVRGSPTYVYVSGFIKGVGNTYTQRYQIGQAYFIYTSGGTGGGGGAAGSGGRGQGADGANASGSTGSAGAGGSAGGTNAGSGGSGGTGGTGGAGGLYGVAGSSGNTGATGNTGASGNYAGGAAGAGGVTGSSGGTAGRYLVKGANSVTINNSGTVAGGLA